MSKVGKLPAIHVFHYNNNGWICTDEFVEAFTNLRDKRILIKLIKFMKIEVQFQEIQENNHPQLFTMLQ